MGSLSLLIPATVIVAVALSLAALPTSAAGTVTNCADDTQLTTMLAGGGTVDFNCGTATIPLISEKTITVNTVIDGGGQITLSGRNVNRLFVIGSEANLTLRNIVLTSGYAVESGGAVLNLGTLILEGVTVRNSRSLAYGGAIQTAGQLDIADSTITNNQAANGGGMSVFLEDAQVTVSRSTFSGNTANGPSPQGTVNSGWGGGVYAFGADVRISDSLFENNAAGPILPRDGLGGAIFNQTVSDLTVTDTVVRGNSAYEGGGIYNQDGVVLVTRTTLSGNNAGNGGSGGGGGLANRGANQSGGVVTIKESTLSDNDASTGTGGGISNFDFDTLVLENSTLSGGVSIQRVSGLFNRGDATLTNVTIVGHDSTEDGTVLRNFGLLRITNTVLGDNVDTNCGFSVAPQQSAFNLSDDGSCGFEAGRNDVDDLNLGPLQDNGGDTLTHLPGVDSAVIDNATGTGCPEIDQRGATRPGGDACDVGSVEADSFPPTPTPTASPTPSPSPTTTPSLTATPVATPTPSGTATTTPSLSATVTPTSPASASPSPTNTGGGTQHLWGDVDCSGAVNPVDSLKVLRHDAGLSVNQANDCPIVGSALGVNENQELWGDVDCSGAVNPVDSLKLLRHDAGLSVQQGSGCPQVGSQAIVG